MLATVASRGEGIGEVVAALDRHRAYLEASGKLTEQRRRRLTDRTRSLVERQLAQWLWDETAAGEVLERRLDAMVEGDRNPYEVAAEILDQVKGGVTP